MDQVGQDLCAHVRRIRGAVCLLVGLPSGRVSAVSAEAGPMFGLDLDAVVGRPVSGLTRGLWRSEPMRLLLAEAQTGFAAPTTLRLADGKLVECSAAVRLLRTPGARWVLIALDSQGTAGSGGTLLRLTDDTDIVVGVGDGDGRIAEVSPGVEDLLGYDVATFVSRSVAGLLHADDFPSFSAGSTAVVATRRTGSLRLRFRHADGSWVPLRLFLSPMGADQPTHLGFVLVPDKSDDPSWNPPGGNVRFEEVEQRLRRIALEIAAFGITDGLGPDMSPEVASTLAQLSVKRQEIVRRLQAGERVPTIAEEMYLSQSTIRNHLSATFRHFGVSSQEELVRLLRGGQTRS